MSRKHALQIFHAALEAADPQRAVLAHLAYDGQILKAGRKRYRMRDFDRVWMIGAGKASAAMASAVERLLGRRIGGGLVSIPDGVTARVRRAGLQHASHPIPDERGVANAATIGEIAFTSSERDLVIALLSGGASALLPAPADGLTLAEKQRLTRELLLAGASIHELNTVRKHLSTIKGGQLAAAAYPARVIALVLSDVIGDDLNVIGSGPFTADPTTVADALAVLDRYGVKLDPDLLRETPKPGDERLSRADHVVVGSNRLAIDVAAKKARDLGYRTLVLSTFLDGESREVAKMHAAVVREIQASGRPVHRPACVLSGGETTVTVRGSGKGGRNLEFVLAAALALEDSGARGTILSAGTDGIDGPTDAAGAIADTHTLRKAKELALDARKFLECNDSYDFFARVEGLIKTGPTGTNVMDIRVVLIP